MTALVAVAAALAPLAVARADDAHGSARASAAVHAHETHGAAVVAPTVVATVVATLATVTDRTSSDCDHCGASRCMTGVHCGTGTAAGGTLAALVGLRGASEQQRPAPAALPASRTSPPPTPPPDLPPNAR